MTQQVAYLEAVVGADITTFRRGMQDVRRELGLFSDTAAGLQHLGRNLTFAVTVPIMAALGGAVKVATDFDAAMRNIASISDEVATNFSGMSSEVRDFGAELRGGPLAAAEALYTVFSAGIGNLDDAFSIARVSARTAEAGLADLQTTTEALVSAMLAFGAPVSDASHYSDVLTRTVQVGVGTMSEFAGSLAQVLPSAAALGISFDDVGANLAYLTQRGFPASRAATSLNNAFSKLLSPSEALGEIFDDLGVRSGKELIATMGGVQAALAAVFESANYDETVIKDFFPDERGFRAIAQIFTDVEAWNKTLREFGLAVDGATDRAHTQQMMSLQAQLDLLTSAIAAFGISVGTQLLPFIQPFVQGLRDLFIEASHLSPEILLLGTTFLGLIAAVGPITWLIGSLLTPIGLLTAGVGTLAVAFATDFGGIRTSITSAVSAALPSLQALQDAVLEFFKILTTGSPTSSAGGGYGIEYDPLSSIGTMPLDASGIQFEVLEGEGPWSIQRRIQEAYGEVIDLEVIRAAVMDQSGVPWFAQGSYTLGITLPTLSFGMEGPMDASGFNLPSGRNPFDKAMDYINGFERTSAPVSIGDKLSAAITEAGPAIMTAFNGLLADIKSWFTTTFLPEFDTWGASILTSITNAFAFPEDGNPLLNLLRSVFALDGTGVSDEVNKALPKITTALDGLFASIGTWLQGEGARSLGETVGYAVGALGASIGSALELAIGAAFGVINTSGGSSSPIGKAAGSLGSGIADGVALALSDSGVDMTNTWDVIFTTIAGSLALAIAAGGLVSALSGAGLGVGIGKSISLAIAASSIVLNAIQWTISFATGGLTSLATYIGQQVTAQLIAGGSIKLFTSSGMGFAIWATTYYVTLAAQALTAAVAAIGAKLSVLLGAVAGGIPVTLAAIALTVALGGIAFAANYDFRNAVKDFLEESLGLDPIDAALKTNINPVIEAIVDNNGNTYASLSERYAAFFAASDAIAPVNVIVPTNVEIAIQEYTLGSGGIAPSPDMQQGIEASAIQDTNQAAMAEALGFTTGQKLSADFQKGIMSGVVAPAEGEGGTTLSFSAGIAQALGNQLLTIDLTSYVPTDNLTSVSNMMVTPFITAFSATFGASGKLALLLTEFNNFVVKFTPTIVGSFKNLASQIVSALAPAIEALEYLSGMMGSIDIGSLNVKGGKGDSYASGGGIGAGNMGWLGGRGVEPFIPGENGTIVPTRIVRDALRGGNRSGGGNTIYITSYGSSPYEIGQVVVGALDNASTQYR